MFPPGWWPATGVGKRIKLHENRSQNRPGWLTRWRRENNRSCQVVVCRFFVGEVSCTPGKINMEPKYVGGWKMNRSLSFKGLRDDFQVLCSFSGGSYTVEELAC